MINKNKAVQVREALGLTPTESGQILIGIDDGKKAYDTWARMEKTGKWSSAINQYLKLLLILAIARDIKTRGAGCALDLSIKMLRDCNED